MKKRPILIAVIGYIIGILWGLYLKNSIVPFYILTIAIYFIYKSFLKNNQKQFKLLSFKHYSKYLKLMVNKTAILILISFSIISNIIVLNQNSIYENSYQDGQNVKIEGIVISQKIEKSYCNLYKIKVLNNKNFNMYIQIEKSEKDLEYGDKIKIWGVYKKPSIQRNYGGYDESKYLKTLKILGKVKVNKMQIEAKSQEKLILQFADQINFQIKKNIDKSFNKENSAILKGLLLGDKQDIEDEIKQDFQTTNISHILAISGMHISYIIIGIQLLFQKWLGKRKTKIITISFLILYILITGFSASTFRATIMGILLMSSSLFYRKNDIWNAIAISIFFILIYNPFLILDIGLQLSYLGTVGIILFQKVVLSKLRQIKLKKESKLFDNIKKILSVTISAQIMIFPVMIYYFHTVGTYFLIANLLVSIIIGPIVVVSFIFICLSLICFPLIKIIKFPIEIGLEVLSLISKIGRLPFSKFYIITPSIYSIIIYLIFIVIIKCIYEIYHTNYLSATQKRIKNLIALFRYKFNQKKKKYLLILTIFLILTACFQFIPKNLKIHFVDVGQGDCTFIITPQNKTILIDGGGSLLEDFDVGKKILIPYLLNKGYNYLDYVIISHFDQDHIGGIMTILEELSVKNIVIGKQYQDCENYKKFLNIVKEKKIKVNVVEKGSKIHIEKKLYFDVLWPNSSQIVSENSINNNALVCKLFYKNFTMLFTGDIEEEAEKLLISQYKNTDYLKSTILKVAHHGSKTSSAKDFLDLVNPKIALIGVGKNNNFGHPNEETIKKLENLRYKNF